jgi:hypothetical protein
MTAMPHECPQCAQTAALAAETRDRLNVVARILLAAYAEEGLTPPAALGAAPQPVTGRTQLRCLPGGAA